MKTLVTFLTFSVFFFVNRAHCQEKVELDFVIIANDELVDGSLTNLHYLIKYKDGRQQRVEINYHPGSLSFDESYKKTIFSAEQDTAFLVFDHNMFCGNKHYMVNYEIPFNGSLFETPYVVLRVYYLGRGKYKNAFEPLSKIKDYTYELDYSGGSMKRAKLKKSRSVKCK